jgi:steroid 5-alpha reductase family enzyme
MKTIFYNILGSIIAFYMPFQIALLTDSNTVVTAVLIAFFIQWVCFIPAFLLQTEKFYDLTGSITYLSLIIFTVFESGSVSAGSLVVAGSVVLWAVRLGSFLFLRIKKDGEDKRFRAIKPSFTRFFMTWTLQGTWVSMCLLCVLSAISSASGIVVNLLFCIGLFLFVLGFGLEIVADSQKSKFRGDPKNKDLFITTGLWALSRHPNYLGELTLWVGIALMSFSSLVGLEYLTLISPVFIYLLLVHISGVRMLEDAGRKKWGHLQSYKNYINSTPKLFIRGLKKGF